MIKKIIQISMATILTLGCQQKDSHKIGYSGEDISDKALITQEPSTFQPVLELEIPGAWSIYAGPSIEKINLSQPVASGNQGGSFPLKVDPSYRSYYQLETEDGIILLAERRLPLKGGFNFRDLGGIRTKDGKYTKWGIVFRSDDLMHLTHDDLDYLKDLPLHTIIDFRSIMESEQSPDQIPTSVREKFSLYLSPGNVTGINEEEIAQLSTAQGDSIMKAINRQLVTDPECISQYRHFFRILQDSTNLPIVFHCTAGKDRTGYGAYLFLSAMGVEEDKIMEDYLSSNHYLEGKYGNYIKAYPFLEPLLTVKEDYLRTVINEIRQQHGSVENYLKDVLEADIDKLREIYLY